MNHKYVENEKELIELITDKEFFLRDLGSLVKPDSVNYQYQTKKVKEFPCFVYWTVSFSAPYQNKDGQVIHNILVDWSYIPKSEFIKLGR